MQQRRTITFRFALDALGTWAADPTLPYRIEQRRWVETHAETYAEYALVAHQHPVGIVCWANETHLMEEERIR